MKTLVYIYPDGRKWEFKADNYVRIEDFITFKKNNGHTVAIIHSQPGGIVTVKGS